MQILAIFGVMIALLGLSFRYGRGPERCAAAIMVGCFVTSVANIALRGDQPAFVSVDPVLATADFMALVLITTVALAANRLWPLVFSALQLLVVLAHLSVAVSKGWTQVYFGMMLVAQYLEVVVLALGLLNHALRERRFGRYRSWRRRVAQPPTAIRPSLWRLVHAGA